MNKIKFFWFVTLLTTSVHANDACNSHIRNYNEAAKVSSPQQAQHMKNFLSAKCELNFTYEINSYYADTPLMVAMRSDDFDSMDKLIKAGADINARPDQLKRQYLPSPTPLEYVVSKCQNDSKKLKFLLDNKADVNKKSPEGKTPLEYAIACEDAAAVGMLLARDAKLNDDEVIRTILRRKSHYGGSTPMQKAILVMYIAKYPEYDVCRLSNPYSQELNNELYFIAQGIAKKAPTNKSLERAAARLKPLTVESSRQTLCSKVATDSNSGSSSRGAK